MIFQDPSGSLDPRKSVKELIGEPLKVYKACENRDEHDARSRRADGYRWSG